MSLAKDIARNIHTAAVSFDDSMHIKANGVDSEGLPPEETAAVARIVSGAGSKDSVPHRTKVCYFLHSAELLSCSVKQMREKRWVTDLAGKVVALRQNPNDKCLEEEISTLRTQISPPIIVEKLEELEKQLF